MADSLDIILSTILGALSSVDQPTGPLHFETPGSRITMLDLEDTICFCIDIAGGGKAVSSKIAKGESSQVELALKTMRRVLL